MNLWNGGYLEVTVRISQGLRQGAVIQIAGDSKTSVEWIGWSGVTQQIKISVEGRGKKTGMRPFFLTLPGSHSSEIIEFSQSEKDIPSTTLLYLAMQQKEDLFGIVFKSFNKVITDKNIMREYAEIILTYRTDGNLLIDLTRVGFLYPHGRCTAVDAKGNNDEEKKYFPPI
jgi:hypothetical protein